MTQLKTLASQLLKFDSSQDVGLVKCFEYCVQYLKKHNINYKIFNSKNKPSLLAAKKIKKSYKYIFVGHIDVVPASYKDAFNPKTKNNRIYGRGASDMKGQVAAMMILMKKLVSENRDEVALMLTSDEEVGGQNGVSYLINQKKYTCDCAIIPDGGNNFHLTIAQKGILHVKITASGKSAHGSRPWQGDNAIEKLIKLYYKLGKKFNQANKKDSWKSSLNLGKIIGGEATNSVAESADMYLDFRYTKEKQKNDFLSILDQEKNKTTYKTIVSGSMMNNKKDNFYIQKIQQVAQEKSVNLREERTTSASDGRFFSKKGIPVIMFNPICSNGHIDNEWIDLKSLSKFSDILYEFVTRK